MNRTKQIEVMNQLTKRLKKTMKSIGSFEQIEQLTGISRSSLQRYATGKTCPKVIDIEKIASITSLSPEYLAFGNEQDLKESIEDEFKKDGRNEDTVKSFKAILNGLKMLTDSEIEIVSKITTALAGQSVNRYLRELQELPETTINMTIQEEQNLIDNLYDGDREEYERQNKEDAEMLE